MVPAGDATTFKPHHPPPRHVTPRQRSAPLCRKGAEAVEFMPWQSREGVWLEIFFGTDLIGDEKGLKGFFCLL